eukprot:scaffold70499_cov33-Attheya_sp.AAC.1
MVTMPMTRHPSVGGHTEQAQHITLFFFNTHPTIIKEATVEGSRNAHHFLMSLDMMQIGSRKWSNF